MKFRSPYELTDFQESEVRRLKATVLSRSACHGNRSILVCFTDKDGRHRDHIPPRDEVVSAPVVLKPTPNLAVFGRLAKAAA